MITLLAVNEKAKVSRIVPVDYVEQSGAIVHFGAHEFGVFGHPAHKAWSDEVIIGPGIRVKVYFYGRLIKEYKE